MAIQSNFPAIRPSLNLDFANTKTLDPRITFTRASTATYYDGKTFAKAEENLVPFSQEFDNAVWSTGTITKTANVSAAPDGTTTADRLAGASATSNLKTVNNTFASGGVTGQYTASFFAKAETHSFIQIAFYGGTGGSYANFDVLNGTVGSSMGGTPSIQSVGDGWYRCVFSNAALTANTSYALVLIDSNASARASNSTTTNSLLVWGAQMEQRDTVTAYTPTTQPITNYIQVLQTAAANVARFDHNPVTGESLGLLIEEQRTNLLLRSQEFDHGGWSKTALTVTTNAVVAPDGTLTADKLVETTATSGHSIFGAATVASGTAYTFSCYLKKAERGFGTISTDAAASTSLVVDLNNGSISSGTGTVVDVGNGWFRLSITFTSTVSGPAGMYAGIRQVAGTSSYTGDGYSGIYIWGAQLEAGAFPTSYIPTVAAQVTRNADAATMTGTNFSSWYRQGEGTLYAEAIRSSLAGNDVVFAAVNDATASNTFELYKPANASSFQLYAAVGNVAQASPVLLSVLTVNVPFKAVGAYRTNDIRGAANGALTAADTSALIPVVNQLALGSRNTNGAWNGHIRKVAYWPTRLPDAQLQALTTP